MYVQCLQQFNRLHQKQRCPRLSFILTRILPPRQEVREADPEETIGHPRICCQFCRLQGPEEGGVLSSPFASSHHTDSGSSSSKSSRIPPSPGLKLIQATLIHLNWLCKRTRLHSSSDLYEAAVVHPPSSLQANHMATPRIVSSIKSIHSTPSKKPR